MAYYLQLMQEAWAAVRHGGKVRLRWNEDHADLDGWRRKFMSALHRRITIKGGCWPTGRKADPLYETSLFRDAHRVRELLTTRIRHYQFETAEARSRFGHLLASHNDDF